MVVDEADVFPFAIQTYTAIHILQLVVASILEYFSWNSKFL